MPSEPWRIEEAPPRPLFRRRELLTELARAGAEAVQELVRSPASEAGLQVDDVIASVDGVPAERLTLQSLNEMFEKAASCALSVRRGERTLSLTLTPRRFI